MHSAFPPALGTVVFDLDGTLVDSAQDVTEAVNRTLADHGLDPIDEATGRTLMGEGGRVRTRKAFAMRGVELDRAALDAAVRRFVAHYAAHPVERTVAYPGVPETLRGLRDAGLTLAVCTNKYEDSARDVLGRLGLLDWFADVAGADSFDVRKPHPGHLLKLLARIGRPASGAAMVGDSVHDVEAAHAAGLPVIAVTWGYSDRPARSLGAEAAIERFDALPDALRALFSPPVPPPRTARPIS